MNLNKVEVMPFLRSLRAAGHRVTPQRLALFAELRAAADHPSAETLFRRVRRRHPTVSRASVYKTMHLLSALGLAIPLEGADGVTRYDGRSTPHVNAVCVRCGTVVDLAADVSRLLPQLARASGFLLERHLTVRGLCPKCRKAGQAQSKEVQHGRARSVRRRGGRR